MGIYESLEASERFLGHLEGEPNDRHDPSRANLLKNLGVSGINNYMGIEDLLDLTENIGLRRGFVEAASDFNSDVNVVVINLAREELALYEELSCYILSVDFKGSLNGELWIGHGISEIVNKLVTVNLKAKEMQKNISRYIKK